MRVHQGRNNADCFDDNDSNGVMAIQTGKVVKCIQGSVPIGLGYEERAGSKFTWRADAAICAVIFTKFRAFRVAARVRAG